MFKKLIGIWILALILGAASLGKSPPQSAAPQSEFMKALKAKPAPVERKELTAVEKCANDKLLFDRSLSVTQAFEICKAPPAQQFETWLATRSFNRSSRAIPVEVVR